MIGRMVNLEKHGDERGELIALESLSEQIDFEIKRVYYLYDTSPGVIRGLHAHKCLKQMIVCISGFCKIKLDDGTNSEIIALDDPSKGLVIENNIWREMFDFSDDAVLLVLASEHYNESDYIRNYEDFLRFAGKKQ